MRVFKSFPSQLIINAEILTKMAKDLGAMLRKDRSIVISNKSGPVNVNGPELLDQKP